MHAKGRKQALCKVNICNDLTSPTTWPECTLLNGKVTQMPYSLSTPGQFQLKSSRSVLLAVVCWLFDRSSSCKQLDGMYNTSLRWVWKRACRQGRTEVSWLSGQEISLTSQCSSLRSFRSKFTVLKKVLVTLLGLFDAFPVIRRPGHLPPRYALPARSTQSYNNVFTWNCGYFHISSRAIHAWQFFFFEASTRRYFFLVLLLTCKINFDRKHQLAGTKQGGWVFTSAETFW